jgi:putative transposase
VARSVAAPPPDVRKGSAFPGHAANKIFGRGSASPAFATMVTISKDAPCLFVTTVTRNRLPVFRTEALKAVACKALDEARFSGGFALFAYVIMPDHLHVLTDGALRASETLRYINGILSRRVLGYLKDGSFRASLEKLRSTPRKQGPSYSLVDHHSNALPVFSEGLFMQKVNYIHQNPVRAGLVQRAEDYRWSSARYWSGCPTEDEPLRVDVDKIVWRKPRR